MRYSLEHKAQNHENILSVAARSFREHGGDSSGIGTVMKKVGLTKGGFYRHFKSKDDLFIEAMARAFDEMGSGMLKIAKSAPEGQALRAIIEYYLSPRHANSPGMGCVIAALGPELARKPLSVRKRIEASRENVSRAVTAICSWSDARRKSGEVSAVVSQYGWGADCGPDDLVP